MISEARIVSLPACMGRGPKIAKIFADLLVALHHHSPFTPTRRKLLMQPEHTPSAGVAAPNLAVLPPVTSRAASTVHMNDCEPNVLGLGLMRRTVMAASRAGYSGIFFLSRDRATATATTAIPDWNRLAEVLA